MEPPGLSGELRGCGRTDAPCVVEEATEDGGGERMKPPDGGDAIVKIGRRTGRSETKGR